MSEQTLDKRFISRLLSVQRTSQASLFVLSAPARARGPVLARFARETDLLREARHPHLLRNVQADPGEGGRSAEPLSSEWPGDSGWLCRLTLRGRLRVFAEIASAVGGLHRAGMVHGVLHPDRIGMRSNGEAVLLDLGMTWMAGSVRGGGDVLDYCAPECFSSRRPDARADIYSLGLLLHYLLTGEAPPARGRAGHIAGLSVLPENLIDLQPLLALMLAEQPAQRLGSVTMLLDQLNALVMRSPRLAARLEDDRAVGEVAFERLLTPLSALSQRLALAATVGTHADVADANRWDVPAGAGHWDASWLGLGIPLVCGIALLIWLQTRPQQELGLIEKLIQRADSQLDEGKLLLPAEDNALDTLRTLRIADPHNDRLSVIAGQIEQGAARVIEQALQRGRLDEADLALSRAIRAFPDDGQLATLSGSLAQARREEEERERLQQLFVRIDERLAEEALRLPHVDEAMVLLRRAQALARRGDDVAERRMRLVSILQGQAKSELGRGRLEQAKDRLDRLRELAPAEGSLAMLEAEYRQLLGVEAHRKQLAKLLTEAAAAERAGIERPDGLRRALDGYMQAIRLAPDDVAANGRIAWLGGVALARARRSAEQRDWNLAREYLVLGQQALPGNSELALLDARVTQGAREQSAALRKLLDQADLALRRGNYFSPEERSAWALYQRAQAYAQARDDLREGLKRLRVAVLTEVDGLMAQRRYDDASALVEKARQHIVNDVELGRRKLTLASIIEQRSAGTAVPAEGFLAINAIPWAHVHSVADARSGQRVALEADATTPLRLTVPAGDYLVQLRDPENGQLRELRARVPSGGGANISTNLRSDQ